MVSGSNQSSNRTNLEHPSTNTKSTPSHKSSKFSLDSKPFFRIQNSSHPPRPQQPNSTAKQKPPTQVQNFTPNSPSKPSAQKHAKTHKHSALTQGLAARKVQKHPGGQPAGSPGHAYAPDASSEDPDPRAASSGQSEGAVGRYKSRGANQRLGTPLKNPLASRALHLFGGHPYAKLRIVLAGWVVLLRGWVVLHVGCQSQGA